MPAMICDKHGRQLAPMVCSHIKNFFDCQQDVPAMVLVRGQWIDPSAIFDLFWCCPACAKRYGFTSDEMIDFIEVPEDFGRTLQPVCTVCFDEWRKRSMGVLSTL